MIPTQFAAVRLECVYRGSGKSINTSKDPRRAINQYQMGHNTAYRNNLKLMAHHEKGIDGTGTTSAYPLRISESSLLPNVQLTLSVNFNTYVPELEGGHDSRVGKISIH